MQGKGIRYDLFIVGSGYLFSSWSCWTIDFYYLSCTKTQIIKEKRSGRITELISQHHYPLIHQCCSNLLSFFTFIELGGLYVYMSKRNETGVQPDPNPCQPAWVTTLGRMKYFECQTNSKKCYTQLLDKYHFIYFAYSNILGQCGHMRQCCCLRDMF